MATMRYYTEAELQGMSDHDRMNLVMKMSAQQQARPSRTVDDARSMMRQQRCDEILAMPYEQALKRFPGLSQRVRSIGMQDVASMGVLRNGWALRDNETRRFLMTCIEENLVSDVCEPQLRPQDIAAMAFDRAFKIYPGLQVQYTSLPENQQAQVMRAWERHDENTLRPYVQQWERGGAFSVFHKFEPQSLRPEEQGRTATPPRPKKTAQELQSELQELTRQKEDKEKQLQGMGAVDIARLRVQFDQQLREMKAQHDNIKRSRELFHHEKTNKAIEAAVQKAWLEEFSPTMERDLTQWKSSQESSRLAETQRDITQRKELKIKEAKREEEKAIRAAKNAFEEKSAVAQAEADAEMDGIEAVIKAEIQSDYEHKYNAELRKWDGVRSTLETRLLAQCENDYSKKEEREEAKYQLALQKKKDEREQELVAAHARQQMGALADRVRNELEALDHQIFTLQHELDGIMLEQEANFGRVNRCRGAAAVGIELSDDEVTNMSLDMALSRIPLLSEKWAQTKESQQDKIRQDWEQAKNGNADAKAKLKQWLQYVKGNKKLEMR